MIPVMFSSNYHILATIAAVATATVAIIFLASSDTDHTHVLLFQITSKLNE